jgi:uncharacterized protein YjbI with pentapeptide repeats
MASKKDLVPTGKQAEEMARAEDMLGKVKSVNESLADISELIQNAKLLQSWGETLSEAMPWASAIAEAATETIGPIKFLVKLFEAKTKITDPNQLGYLACTLAYQQAIEQTLRALAPEIKLRKGEVRTRLHEGTTNVNYNFRVFALDRALEHEFVRDADGSMRIFSEALGFDEGKTNHLIADLHQRFPMNLAVILSHGQTRDRFAPFRDLIELPANKIVQAKHALRQHADYQRWIYEERRILRGEPFALIDVYIDTECGKLTWGDIDGRARGRRETPLDPFNEKNGGRHSLLGTVLDLVADPTFREAIVVQGPAGSGKSSFTLRLCWELVRHGLQPIRVALKDLDTRDEVSIAESLPAAVRLDDLERNIELARVTFGPELFGDNDSIFQEQVQFKGSTICPYVVILDGWDELSVGASVAFQHQVDRVLGEVRHRFLDARGKVPVRVIVTGRPTDAVAKSKFLRQDTVILTMRVLRPEQLRQYLHRLVKAATDAPRGCQVADDHWEGLSRVDLGKLVARYEQAWWSHHRGGASVDSLDILGSPLLAFLALRLLARQPERTDDLLHETTTLYRSLLDLVIGKAGKPEDADDDVTQRAVLHGHELRELLRDAAEVMTLRATESITYQQLTNHIQLGDEELGRRVNLLADEHVLSRLLISFFFQGGHPELGCEFSHKSFREYLFAEQIVEFLKTHGNVTEAELPEKPRHAYDRDFPEDDRRRTLCHGLAHLCGNRWMSNEVIFHIENLIAWEIERTTSSDSHPPMGMSTEPLSLDAWTRVRDHLADAWDWWAEGVHLRPQLHPKPLGRQRDYLLVQPLALEVIEANCTRPLSPQTFRPMRTTTVDAHLGDALFRLTSSLHRNIALLHGYESANEKDKVPYQLSALEQGPRRYQCMVTCGEYTWILFAPSGGVPDYLDNYFARINAAGYRPHGYVPYGFDMRALDLRKVSLLKASLSDADFSGTDFTEADLHRADFAESVLAEAKFTGANLSSSDFLESSLIHADLSHSDLNSALLERADLEGANLSLADLTFADLREANLSKANLSKANLSAADLSAANLSAADLSEADLSQANLSKANLSKANLSAANLSEADLSQADLSQANLSQAVLNDAKVSRRQLETANITGAHGLPSIDDTDPQSGDRINVDAV